MTINQIKAVDEDFGDKYTIKVSGFNDDGGRITNRDILAAINKLCARVDKLEQIVHYVLDVFKRNNLK